MSDFRKGRGRPRRGVGKDGRAGQGWLGFFFGGTTSTLRRRLGDEYRRCIFVDPDAQWRDLLKTLFDRDRGRELGRPQLTIGDYGAGFLRKSPAGSLESWRPRRPSRERECGYPINDMTNPGDQPDEGYDLAVEKLTRFKSSPHEHSGAGAQRLAAWAGEFWPAARVARREAEKATRRTRINGRSRFPKRLGWSRERTWAGTKKLFVTQSSCVPKIVIKTSSVDWTSPFFMEFPPMSSRFSAVPPISGLMGGTGFAGTINPFPPARFIHSPFPEFFPFSFPITHEHAIHPQENYCAPVSVTQGRTHSAQDPANSPGWGDLRRR